MNTHNTQSASLSRVKAALIRALELEGERILLKDARDGNEVAAELLRRYRRERRQRQHPQMPVVVCAPQQRQRARQRAVRRDASGGDDSGEDDGGGDGRPSRLLTTACYPRRWPKFTPVVRIEHDWSPWITAKTGGHGRFQVVITHRDGNEFCHAAGDLQHALKWAKLFRDELASLTVKRRSTSPKSQSSPAEPQRVGCSATKRAGWLKRQRLVALRAKRREGGAS
jgi:hypothetical protein